jgi:hypothetical protein
MNEQSTQKMPLAAAWQAMANLAVATRAARARSGDKFIGTTLGPHNGTEPTVHIVRVIRQHGRRSPIVKTLSAPLTCAQAEEFLRAYEFDEDDDRQNGTFYAHESEPLTLVIGRRHRVLVHSLQQASEVYCKLRDESDEGSRTWPEGRVGKHFISYNGKVWSKPSRLWQSGDEPVYDPYSEVAA